MCNNIGFLTLILVIKVIVLIVIPVIIIYLHFKNKQHKHIYLIEIALLLLFIILKISGNSCVLNSTRSYINKSKVEIDYTNNHYSIDPNIVEKVVTKDVYKNLDKNVYYFNNTKLPLSEKKINCSKEVYLKHYGNNITAVSMLLSSTLDRNIDPIEIMNIAVNHNIFDCEKGVETDTLLETVAQEYHLRVKHLNKEYVKNFIQTGGVVLAKAIFAPGFEYNVACDESNIILYKVNLDDQINILSPNDKDYEYICPSNSAGYGQIISSNLNNKSWSLSEIDTISYDYITLERE